MTWLGFFAIVLAGFIVGFAVGGAWLRACWQLDRDLADAELRIAVRELIDAPMPHQFLDALDRLETALAHTCAQK